MANHPYDLRRPEPKGVMDAVEAGDMDRLRLALAPRQLRFCQEYVVDFNGMAAILRAGYQTKYPRKMAHQLLKHRGVLAYIEHLSQSKEAKIVAVDPDYIIQQVTTIIGKEDAKDSDRLRGLELLARHLGMFVDRTELTGKDGGPLEIEQRKVEEEAQAFTNLLDSLRKQSHRDDDTTTNVVDIKRKA